MAADSPGSGGFLPPEPSGPEPDLGRRPQPPAAPPPPPAQPQPPVWQQAPATGPDNGPAVLGFSLSISSLGLLIISAGLSSLLSVGLAIPGMLQSRKGTQRVQDGVTTRSAGLASAGWILGIVALVLSAVATIFWIVIAIAVATDDEVRREFEDELDRQRNSSISALLVVARVVGAALL